MAFNVLEGMQYIQQQGELGRQRGQENRLSQLSQQAYGATGADREAALGQMEGVRPGQGLAYGKQVQARDNDEAARGGNVAKYMIAALQSKDPAKIQGAYLATMPYWQQHANGAPLPDVPDETMLPMLYQLEAAAAGSAGQGDNDMKSLRIGANGNYWAIRNGQFVDTGTAAAPTNQIVDTGNGFVGIDKRTLGSSPVIAGGPQQAPQQQAPQMMQVQYATDDGSSIPANEQAMAQAAMAANARGEDFTINASQRLPPMAQPQQGQQLRSTPNPMQQAADRRAEDSNQRAEQANMRAYDSAQRAERGNAPAGQRFDASGNLVDIPGARVAGGNKPMPVGALKSMLEVEDALGGAETAFALSAKHLRRIGNGELTIGPMQRATSGIKTFLGQAGANDVNYNELIGDRTKLVNDSLRLNKGVQTEGDAQRAASEMMNSNDQATTVRAFKRLVEINKRGMELQRKKRAMIEANYAGKNTPSAPSDSDIDSLLEQYP